jgi:hypothetical protein
MDSIIGLLLFSFCICSILALLIITHLRPLNDKEIQAVAGHRRRKAIQTYYDFDHREYSVNNHFKKNMQANGYKKHEWIIVAFEHNHKVDKIWLNKGQDYTQVDLNIDFYKIKNIAESGAYTSVLVFHNHPNSNPSYYSMTEASTKDKDSATKWANQLLAIKVNLIEFVCERGNHYIYWRSVSDRFFPIESFVENLERINGIHWSKNLGLHWERLFGN